MNNSLNYTNLVIVQITVKSEFAMIYYLIFPAAGSRMKYKLQLRDSFK